MINLEEMGQKAKNSARLLALVTAEAKNAAMSRMADWRSSLQFLSNACCWSA